MVTSLFAPGTPLFQSPALLQVPVPPFQLSGVPRLRKGNEPPWRTFEGEAEPAPLDTLLPVSGRMPLWRDLSLRSPDRSRLRWNFLVVAKAVLIDKTAQMSRTSDAGLDAIICLSSIPFRGAQRP